MGLLSTVKGWFNIGGVKVKITEIEDRFPRGNGTLSAKFTISTKTDKTILGTSARFVVETTSGSGDDKETETDVLGEMDTKNYLMEATYPFELKAGETRDLGFTIVNVDLKDFTDHLAAKGGMLGAAGKAAKFLGGVGKKVEYYVEVTVDVQGTPFDPSDRRTIKVVD